MTIHLRLLALARDPEIPRWCRLAIAGGLLIPGPLDELVIYPAVMGYVWLRRRHVLERHGFHGAHALAALCVLVTACGLAGVVGDLVVGFLR